MAHHNIASTRGTRHRDVPANPDLLRPKGQHTPQSPDPLPSNSVGRKQRLATIYDESLSQHHPDIPTSLRAMRAMLLMLLALGAASCSRQENHEGTDDSAANHAAANENLPEQKAQDFQTRLDAVSRDPLSPGERKRIYKKLIQDLDREAARDPVFQTTFLSPLMGQAVEGLESLPPDEKKPNQENNTLTPPTSSTPERNPNTLAIASFLKDIEKIDSSTSSAIEKVQRFEALIRLIENNRVLPEEEKNKLLNTIAALLKTLDQEAKAEKFFSEMETHIEKTISSTTLSLKEKRSELNDLQLQCGNSEILSEAQRNTLNKQLSQAVQELDKHSASSFTIEKAGLHLNFSDSWDSYIRSPEHREEIQAAFAEQLDAVLEVLESYDIPIPTLNIQIEYNPVTLEQPENYTSFESIDVKLGNTTYEALLAKKSPAHMVRLPGINPKIFVEQILKIALESLSSSNLYGNALVRVLMGTIESNNPNLISGLEPPLPEGISGEERDRTIENKALKNKDFLEALIRGFGWEKASFPYLLQSQGLDLDEDILGAAAAADRWKDIDPITIGRAIKALQRRENAELRARKLSTEDGSRIIVGANFLKAFLTESFPDLAKQLYSDTSLFERPQEGQKVLICYTTKQREMIIVSAVWQFTLLPIRTNNQGGKVEEEGVSLRPLSIILSFPQKNGDFKIFQGDPENPFDQMKIPQELGNKVFITPIDGSETDRFIQLQGKDNSKQ